MVTVFHCKCCVSFKCLTLRLLLQHINAKHSNDINFKVQCGVDGCPSIFTKYNSLYRHTLRHHENVYNKNSTEEIPANTANSSDEVSNTGIGANDFVSRRRSEEDATSASTGGGDLLPDPVTIENENFSTSITNNDGTEVLPINVSNSRYWF